MRQSVAFAAEPFRGSIGVMWRFPFLPIIVLALAGCDARIERFEPNEVFAITITRSRATPAEIAMEDSAVAVERLFGTPDEPRWPADLLQDPALVSLVDPARLALAAGPVSSDKEGVNHGLYRKHCVNCHGLDGGGAGPASLFQNPYPRNFRHGVFKWKSTERGSKPTRDDLRALLQRGVASTGMPSFALLDENDSEALVDYVIYLSVRGEVERRLIAAAVDELGYADEAPPEKELQLRNDSTDSEAHEVVLEVLERVLGNWQGATGEVVSVPPFKEISGAELASSVQRGKEIFHGKIANCAGCHGPDGNGEVFTLDYDDWSKEYSTRIGVTPTDREAMRPLRDAGALPPRPAKPREFAAGVFRGGGAPEVIYRQISQGIAGTPMPAVQILEEGNGVALTPDQVWDLVRYVQSLGQGK